MSHGDPIEYFGLFCPDGGDFHICQDSRERFIGCCDVDPCGSGSCPSSSLHPASFNTSRYNEILVQDCDSSGGSRNWFTCTNGPFMGCCTSNPCDNGSCPADDLVDARLSDNSANAAIFMTSSSATPTSSTSSTLANPTSSTTSTPSASPAPSNQAKPDTSGPPVGKIVGGTVGGVAAVILIVCFIFLYMRRRRADARENQSATDDHATTSNPPWSPYKDSYATSPSAPSPAFPSPSLTNNGRTSVVSQISSPAPTWDSRHNSYTTPGTPSQSNYWASQQQQHQPTSLNPVSELEGSSLEQYHELDAGSVPQGQKSDVK